MTANVGTVDRVLRLLAGIALIAAAIFSGLPVFDGVVLKYGAVIVGLILVVTAVTRFCAIYKLLGVKTCRA